MSEQVCEHGVRVCEHCVCACMHERVCVWCVHAGMCMYDCAFVLGNYQTR